MSQPHSVSPEREALRRKFNLRVVTEKEEGRSVHEVPEGTYGFTSAPATDELPVFAKPVFRAFELLRLASGEILFAGYVTAGEAESIEAGLESLSVDFYPEPYLDHDRLAAVPLSRIDRRRPPTRDEGNSMRMEIAPAR